ncbi:gliding motility-associated C-terminal domain-containing protein [bacterium]|nr:gliding motility-associated C-terminal domain-containing protein [bacterium]
MSHKIYRYIFIATLLFLVDYTSVFAQEVLFDNWNNCYWEMSLWQCLIDTLESHGAIVHLVSDEGWENLHNMDMVWIQCPSWLYYDDSIINGVIEFSRNGGRIVIGGMERGHECQVENFNNLLSNLGWETSISFVWDSSFICGGYTHIIFSLPPITQGVDTILMEGSQRITCYNCGGNCYPFVYFEYNDSLFPVALISFPFLKEDNCSSYIIVITGTHSWLCFDSEIVHPDTRRFASNILLTAAGVPGYEFDPCAFADSVFPQSWGCCCSRAPNPFTPNGDGVNDYCQFTFDGLGSESAVLRIFDIHSHEVRRIEVPAGLSAKQHARWDGRDNNGNPLPEGIYLYTIEVFGEVVCDGSVVIAR